MGIFLGIYKSTELFFFSIKNRKRIFFFVSTFRRTLESILALVHEGCWWWWIWYLVYIWNNMGKCWKKFRFSFSVWFSLRKKLITLCVQFLKTIVLFLNWWNSLKTNVETLKRMLFTFHFKEKISVSKKHENSVVFLVEFDTIKGKFSIFPAFLYSLCVVCRNWSKVNEGNRWFMPKRERKGFQIRNQFEVFETEISSNSIDLFLSPHQRIPIPLGREKRQSLRKYP